MTIRLLSGCLLLLGIADVFAVMNMVPPAAPPRAGAEIKRDSLLAPLPEALAAEDAHKVPPHRPERPRIMRKDDVAPSLPADWGHAKPQPPVRPERFERHQRVQSGMHRPPVAPLPPAAPLEEKREFKMHDGKPCADVCTQAYCTNRKNSNPLTNQQACITMCYPDQKIAPSCKNGQTMPTNAAEAGQLGQIKGNIEKEEIFHKFPHLKQYFNIPREQGVKPMGDISPSELGSLHNALSRLKFLCTSSLADLKKTVDKRAKELNEKATEKTTKTKKTTSFEELTGYHKEIAGHKRTLAQLGDLERNMEQTLAKITIGKTRKVIRDLVNEFDLPFKNCLQNTYGYIYTLQHPGPQAPEKKGWFSRANQ